MKVAQNGLKHILVSEFLKCDENFETGTILKVATLKYALMSRRV